jgi:hypothetical protein
MTRVTRDVDLACAHDLLDGISRACISFTSDVGAEVLPVAFARRDGRFLAGVSVGDEPQPQGDQEVVLLIDEGIHFFDLRAIYIRGRLKSVDAPANTQADCRWFDVSPRKIVAWDYGSLRVVHEG